MYKEILWIDRGNIFTLKLFISFFLDCYIYIFMKNKTFIASRVIFWFLSNLPRLEAVWLSLQRFGRNRNVTREVTNVLIFCFSYILYYIYIYIYIYICIYVWDREDTAIQNHKMHKLFTFYIFTCYVYLTLRSLRLLVHKYIAYKPFTILQCYIISFLSQFL